MPPKKKKGKKGKKEAETTEPPHDPSWERAVESGVWDRPPDALPDAALWPTWGAYRERILTSVKEVRTPRRPLAPLRGTRRAPPPGVGDGRAALTPPAVPAPQVKITWHRTLKDEFAAELIKLSPPNMKMLTLHGSENLTQLVLSPIGCCPSLTDIDLASCKELKMVMVQSDVVKRINVSRCPSLSKALIQCKNLEKLVSNHIPQLQTLVIWSDTLAELDVSSSKELFKCELYCPKLRDPKIPPIRRKRVDEEQQLPDIADILKRDYQIEARKEAELKEHQASIVEVGHTHVPRCYRL